MSPISGIVISSGGVRVIFTNTTCLVTRINISPSGRENRVQHTRSVQKIRELYELRGSSWIQENPLHVARFVQIS